MSRITAVPQFHDTITIPVVGRPDGLRVVVTVEGIVGPLVRFLELPRHRDKSQSWQHKVCRAVGLLYDYFVAVPAPMDLVGRRAYLSQFARDLMRGTIGGDGRDPSGLYWRPAASWAQVKETLAYINAFADHCATTDGTERLNPLDEASFGERVARYRALDIQNSHSLLKHLGNAKATYDDARRGRAVRARRQPTVAPSKPPYFPRDRFAELVEVGFRRRGRGGAPWERYQTRDIMLAMLQRYGGLRASEPFHLFTRDVQEDRDKPGHARVLLYHPELGRFRYPDPLQRRVLETTRSEYLRTQCGREPRNLIAGKDHAGWKDLMLDEGAPHYYALIRWFPSEAGAVFWQLYQAYVRHVLPSGLAHPYLFVTLDSGPWFGQPYRMAAYQRALSRAVRRIGLPFKKSLGTTSHGFRHAYGQDLEDAKVDRKVIQTCMHHKSPLSQDVYTRPEKQRVSRELEAARLRLAEERATSLAVPDLLGDVQRLLR